MISFFRSLIRSYFNPGSIVLRYGRASKQDPGIWPGSVSAKNLEMHLEVLAGEWKPVSLRRLVDDLKAGKLRNKSVALCFDSGYADDYDLVRPILEKLNIPAVFFIDPELSAPDQLFWYDELERLILFSRHLPPIVRVSVAGEKIEFEVARETVLTDNIKKQYGGWTISDKPVNLRTELFQMLFKKMVNLDSPERRAILTQIQAQSSIVQRDKSLYKRMDQSQIEEIGRNRLFEIGLKSSWTPGHTIPMDILLKREKETLEKFINHPVQFVAFNGGEPGPAGKKDIDSLGFTAAILRSASNLKKGDDPLETGSFTGADYNLYAFRRNLKKWKSQQSI